MRLMLSTPQPIATSTSPEATSAAAIPVACCEEPHWASIEVAATDSGSPAVSHAVRETLIVCSPIWLTQPPTICPTSDGSIPERATRSR
jgi:hypothetical protein